MAVWCRNGRRKPNANRLFWAAGFLIQIPGFRNFDWFAEEQRND